MNFIVFFATFFLIFSIITMFELFLKLLELLKTILESLIEFIKNKPSEKKIKNIIQYTHPIHEETMKHDFLKSLPVDSRVLDKIKYFKSIYPYCDNNLLDRYKNEFIFLPKHEILELERQIRLSHDYAIKNKKLNLGYIHYTDISDINKLETISIYPINMTFHCVQDVYVLIIEHLQTSEKVIYKSKRKTTLLQLCNDIYDFVENKNNLLFYNINDLYDQNKYIDIEEMI